jgi:hypothetical protein
MKTNPVAAASGADSSQRLGNAFGRDLERGTRPTEFGLHAVEILACRNEFRGSRDEETGARLATLPGHFPGPDGEQDLGIRRDVLLCLMHSPGRDQQMAAVRDLDVAVPSIDEMRFGAKRRNGSHALVSQDFEEYVGEHW